MACSQQQPAPARFWFQEYLTGHEAIEECDFLPLHSAADAGLFR